MTPLLLALDPSLRCTGVVVCELAPPHALVEVAAIPTESRVDDAAPALLRVFDDARRGVELSYTLRELLAMHPAVALLALEAPLGSQDASAAAFLARANQAVVDAIDAARPDLAEKRRIVFASSYAAKRAATGTKKPEDAKRDVRASVIRRWGPSAFERAFVLGKIRGDRQREAVFDAAAVALLALEQPLVRVVLEEHARISAHETEGRP